MNTKINLAVEYSLSNSFTVIVHFRGLFNQSHLFKVELHNGKE